MKNTDTQTLEQLQQILNTKNQKAVIIIHENPDGDAIGSAIGFAEVLKTMQHEVTVISPTDYPRFLQWFSSDVEIVNFQFDNKKSAQLIEESDILFCLDHNVAERAGEVKQYILDYKKPKILIDHHPYPAEYFTITISEPSYAATAELFYTILEKLNIENLLNKNGAEALLTGIITDTGSFSHNISNPNTFRVVAKLIEYGVNPDYIQDKVYNNYSKGRMQLLGYALKDKMIVLDEYKAAVIYLSQDDLKKYDFKSGDTEGFVNYPLSIGNVVFSTLFIENENFIKASFRSKGDFPANQFAKQYFNGGGHLNAAGGRIELTLDQAVEKWTQHLDEFKHLLINTKI